MFYPYEIWLRGFLEPEISREYVRTCDQFVDADRFIYNGSGHCLNVLDVLRTHFLIANHFFIEGSGLGGLGPRDCGLLESAVFRQAASFQGLPKWRNIFETCATLFFGLIMTHPFHDANKRTALLSLLYQLQQEGWCPSIGQQQIEDFTVKVADHKLQYETNFRLIEANNNDDKEVKYIAQWIRRSFRKIDHTNRAISYRTLKSILNRYGFSLEEPHDNQINVVFLSEEFPERKLVVDLGHASKIGQLGFPRWGAQVSKSDLKRVREMTGLTPQNGVDSASFFDGGDSVRSLIATYHDLLARLANR